MIRAQVGSLMAVIDCIQSEYVDQPFPRINEFRIHCYIKREAETDGQSQGFSNCGLGKHLLEALILSKTKGQVLDVTDGELSSVPVK
jgi:hypothetical protein